MVRTDTNDIVEDVRADDRGRITLGAEYAGETVSVAVVEREGGDE